MLSGEATNINLIVCGLTWPGLDDLSHIGKHANYYNISGSTYNRICAIITTILKSLDFVYIQSFSMLWHRFLRIYEIWRIYRLNYDIANKR
jgi:hypothetical protein